MKKLICYLLFLLSFSLCVNAQYEDKTIFISSATHYVGGEIVKNQYGYGGGLFLFYPDKIEVSFQEFPDELKIVSKTFKGIVTSYDLVSNEGVKYKLEVTHQGWEPVLFKFFYGHVPKSNSWSRYFDGNGRSKSYHPK